MQRYQALRVEFIRLMLDHSLAITQVDIRLTLEGKPL